MLTDFFEAVVGFGQIPVTNALVYRVVAIGTQHDAHGVALLLGKAVAHIGSFVGFLGNEVVKRKHSFPLTQGTPWFLLLRCGHGGCKIRMI